MTKTSIYGIKNCDTMKKAFKWLEANNIIYEFHDYKKQAPDEAILKQTIAAHGWENVINCRGTTWRNLSDDVQNAMDGDSALQTARDNPSIIKRPLLMYEGESYLGFKEEQYMQIFAT